jgi:hypothetical protein
MNLMAEIIVGLKGQRSSEANPRKAIIDSQ